MQSVMNIVSELHVTEKRVWMSAYFLGWIYPEPDNYSTFGLQGKSWISSLTARWWNDVFTDYVHSN